MTTSQPRERSIWRRIWRWLRWPLLLLIVLLVSGGVFGCNLLLIIVSIIVPVPDYPAYESKEAISAEAQQLSEGLAAHIDAWLDGDAPATIPTDLIPNGKQNGIQNLRLVHPDEVTPDDIWLVREAETLDPDALKGAFPDPHATYAIIPAFYLPFEHSVVVEGEFPHARFFDLQASPPFDPAVYRYEGAFGAAEVALVDVDIEPLPGHTNPFRVGADRTAEQRSYRTTWTMTTGNGTEIEPAYRPPYRAPGNHRYVAAIQYQGPWGKPGTRNGHGRGVWDVGHFWLRYYAPDHAAGPLGGVPLPDVHYETPDGRPYLIIADTNTEEMRINAGKPMGVSAPMDPGKWYGSDIGWNKGWGIFHSISSGLAIHLFGYDSDEAREYVRKLDLGVTGRGENQPPPGNYAVSASDCVYIHYLLRGMALEDDHVAILVGKLPTTPRTRNGEPMMQSAQARYWSITGYDPRIDTPIPGTAVHSVMDEDIVTTDDGWYVIVFSREDDRPANAVSEAGVTWVNWGTIGYTSWTLRWMTIPPEWEAPDVPTPLETNLTWSETAWAGTEYDASILGTNDRTGYLGDYQPMVHYMSRADFESLGDTIDPDRIPTWTED